MTFYQEPLAQTRVAAKDCRILDDGNCRVNFPRAVFGTITVPLAAIERRSVVVHLGEKLDAAGRIDRDPPGTIRYRRIEQTIEPGQGECRIQIPPDTRNTGPAAIQMPESPGEVLPFRYAEIEDAASLGLQDPMRRAGIRQIFVHYPFDDQAADFCSSSSVLDAVWELCKYSIKATSFCGIYVDGDRERIPYEGDAYINQLGHYGVDHEYGFARRSHEYMIQHPTWCTEWHLHSVMMAWMDYLYTGDATSMEAFYDDLCAKTLLDFARDDGLISVAPELRTPAMQRKLDAYAERGIVRENIRDVVDWPPGSFSNGGTGERDDHEMRPINSVVNAFHCHALRLMGRVASVLGRMEDHARFVGQADLVQQTINRLLFDAERGVYLDGVDSTHASLHSNMFMLAFDLVPAKRRNRVLNFVKSRGMACSVYGAQHLLEALYRNGEDRYALELMTAQHDRSWWNMIQTGATMTMEAWDLKYKNNLDWNHAWGAAPANIIPRYVLGVQALTPGFAEFSIRPQPGSLTHAAGRVPSCRGPIEVAFQQDGGHRFAMQVEIPAGTTARVALPCNSPISGIVQVNGRNVAATPAAAMLKLDAALKPGRHEILVESDTV